LTNLRSALVKKEHLARVARSLDLGSVLEMSKGEASSGGREKDYLLANLVEALIGAFYLTYGWEISQKFITQYILKYTEEILQTQAHIDAKSAFQELAQGAWGITPIYRVISESGLDHEKTFEIGAYLDKKRVGIGRGASKKEAQSAAAQHALDTQNQWRESMVLVSPEKS
jgi:ribonuclease III